MLRQLPPVHSPLNAAAIGVGAAAALLPARADQARQEVEAWLRTNYQPAGWLWTDSGTSALTIALRLASENARRPVALPAYGCYDLATACDGAGVQVLLYDIDPATLGPDWNSLERVLQAGAGVLVVVHLYGIPVDLDRATGLAERHGAVVVEDAAQGIGGSWRGKPLGAHGALSILSFGRGKGLTSGGGGALLVHDRAFLERLPPLRAPGKGLSAVGKSAAQWLLSRPSLYWLPASLPFLGLGETVYRPSQEAAGLPAGGFGVLSRTLLEERREGALRRENADALRRLLPGGLALPVPASGLGVAGYLRFPLALDPASRVRLLERGARLGIRAGYPTTLAALGEPFLGRRRADGDLRGAQQLAERVVTLPVHGLVGGEVREVIATVIGRSLKGA